MINLHGREAGFEILTGGRNAIEVLSLLPAWLSDDELALAVQRMGPDQQARLLDAIEAVRDEEEDEG